MSKQKFIDFIEEHPSLKEEMSEEVLEYWTKFREKNQKPMLTSLGKMVLAAMPDTEITSKQLSESIGLAANTVSCALLKLVKDGFVEKIGQKPAIYKITQKGKDVI